MTHGMSTRSVVVVGAGVFGAWSALRLARDGWRVTLIDAYGPANGRASSSDHSRVIRAGYGADTIYTTWATEALADWQWLAKKSGETLVEECGALFLGETGSAHLAATAATLTSGSTRRPWPAGIRNWASSASATRSTRRAAA
jgi:glycine/D-amino acid oxidase-like deaminating enzyme